VFWKIRATAIMSRKSKERMEKALEQLKTISEKDYEKVKASL